MKSRTSIALKNVSIVTVLQIINVIFGFISRTVFIYLLNTDYLGVNGLFSNILTVLSFAELGIGTAIVYHLYKPLANEDIEKLKSLMRFYKYAYICIGIIITLLGLILIPFLNFLIKETPNIEDNLYLIYLLFLSNTSVSYFFSYKKSLISADQKEYVVQFYVRLFQLAQFIVQTVVLLITHNYILYLVTMLIFTILCNAFLAIRANKMFPFLKDKNVTKLEKKERRSIFSEVKALFLYKIGSVINNGMDNIIISTIFGVYEVGLVSNYLLILNAAQVFVDGVITSVVATIGNLGTSRHIQRMEKVLYETLLVTFWIYGLISICFACMANDFITIWIGAEYTLSNEVVIALVISFFVSGVQFAAYSFRTTQGLFVHSIWVPLVGPPLNIIFSFWWGIEFGISGVFLATAFSRIVTTTIVDPWLVYKHSLGGKRPYKYYLKYLFGCVVVVTTFCIIYFTISQCFICNTWLSFILKLVLVFSLSNVVFLLCFVWLPDFRSLFKRFMHSFKH